MNKAAAMHAKPSTAARPRVKAVASAAPNTTETDAEKLVRARGMLRQLTKEAEDLLVSATKTLARFS